MLLKNIGPPWRRRSGELVPHGGTFEATDIEVERFKRRMQWGILFQTVSDTITPSSGVGVPPVVVPPEWPLKMPPREYLEKHPGGKHARLARHILSGEVNA